MSQHDYSIANQGFPATRADINNVLSAIATNNSGTSAPSTQYAGQFWLDTTSSNWVLYIHDGADDIQFATIDTSANTVNFIDSELGDNSVTTSKIADANVTSAKLSYPLTTFSSTGIDDNATSTAITIDSSQNVDIAGTLTIDDTLSISNGTASGFLQTSGSLLQFGTSTAGDIPIYTNNTERMRIDSSGNVGIGTSSPSQKLDVVGSIEVSDGIYVGGTGSANKLDDYEEGTWTPTVSGGLTGFTVQQAKYTKIGQIVNISMYVNALTGASGSRVDIGGLPFTTATNLFPTGVVLSGSGTVGVVRVQSASTTGRLYYANASTGNRDDLTGTLLGSQIILSVTYYVA